MFVLFLSSSGLVCDIIMLVLSANNTGLAILLTIDENSFIWVRKNNGPNTEHCGTPCFVCSHVEYTLLNLLSLSDVFCYLFSKYDPISLFAMPVIP